MKKTHRASRFFVFYAKQKINLTWLYIPVKNRQWFWVIFLWVFTKFFKRSTLQKIQERLLHFLLQLLTASGKRFLQSALSIILSILCFIFRLILRVFSIINLMMKINWFCGMVYRMNSEPVTRCVNLIFCKNHCCSLSSSKILREHRGHDLILLRYSILSPDLNGKKYYS